MKNSGSRLVHRMRKLLLGLDLVESYFDELIIYTKDWDTHLQVLDQPFCSLQQVHPAFRPMKYMFGLKTIKFLGYLVGGNCIMKNQENFEKICQVKCPTMLANSYCNHIPSFVAFVALLSDLMRKGLPERVQ